MVAFGVTCIAPLVEYRSIGLDLLLPRCRARTLAQLSAKRAAEPADAVIRERAGDARVTAGRHRWGQSGGPKDGRLPELGRLVDAAYRRVGSLGRRAARRSRAKEVVGRLLVLKSRQRASLVVKRRRRRGRGACRDRQRPAKDNRQFGHRLRLADTEDVRGCYKDCPSPVR
jgi:hypothetical protein